MRAFEQEDEVLDLAKQSTMAAACETGDTWVVYEVGGVLYARCMTLLLQIGPPSGGREIGRAGIDATGKPFWSTLQ